MTFKKRTLPQTAIAWSPARWRCCRNWARLDERRAELTAAVAAMEANPSLPALHPNMAEVFRQKATALAEGLEDDGQRDAARAALRGFVRAIIIPPEHGLLQVTGNLGAMLDAAAGQRMPGPQAVAYVGCGGGI